MKGSAIKPVLLHGTLVVIGLLAGTLGNHQSTHDNNRGTDAVASEGDMAETRELRVGIWKTEHTS
jgi:hypothetical protein